MSWKCNWINETNYKISEQTLSSCKHAARQRPHSADSAVHHSCSLISAVWVTVGPFSGLRLNSPVNWLPTDYSVPYLGSMHFCIGNSPLKHPAGEEGHREAVSSYRIDSTSFGDSPPTIPPRQWRSFPPILIVYTR